jgi:Asp-tRNA(Asn)/Glu-tRNA(Gln) amidotransferase A subunit family amidase
MIDLAEEIFLDEKHVFERLNHVAAKLQAREISSVELTSKLLSRIETIDRIIGTYSDILWDRALADAAEADIRHGNGKRIGVLDGIPIAIKDLIDTTPATCQAGLPHLQAYVPKSDAAVVDRLRKAGAVVLGVTTTDTGAFGTSTRQTINPLSPDRIAGGSSGGSAAAVAAGMAFAAIGTDTGGSIRIPSACCSVCGFKPSWGRVSVDGIRPLAPSLDHVGPITRTVEDLETVQSVLDPVFRRITTQQSASLKIGVPRSYFSNASVDILNAMQGLVSRLQASNHQVVDVSLPCPTRVLEIHFVNALKEIAHYHRKHFGAEWRNYPEPAKAAVEIGSEYSEEEYQQSKTDRFKLKGEVEKVCEDVDVLLVPTMAMDAPHRDLKEVVIGDQTLSVLEATVLYTALFNQTGHPVVSMPGYGLQDGRAISIQVVGKMNSDENVIQCAKILESNFASPVHYREVVDANLEPARVIRQIFDREEKT